MWVDESKCLTLVTQRGFVLIGASLRSNEASNNVCLVHCTRAGRCRLVVVSIGFATVLQIRSNLVLLLSLKIINTITDTKCSHAGRGKDRFAQRKDTFGNTVSKRVILDFYCSLPRKQSLVEKSESVWRLTSFINLYQIFSKVLQVGRYIYLAFYRRRLNLLCDRAVGVALNGSVHDDVHLIF